ncbi:uncharacterized protein MONOS_13702 [Monocercomonoides exilis]|uniref:uncharacterized protein n=1 Tax=Monocercomonoides exilis TaxID=2049356 RepID=UPI00355A6F0A|nr:hypothetical protein MONOS_13702 [Monocercomonoides exilis]|eukprot:MONOS_13702.1-p1 / transcript=MONOS_13702.1 / gene=MONOS_13702 / organism=Monocercomonoides_exilis_PA203 / gene_product=unspecified product / transcript_product=unspecified product / location=Mono_scaffold00867:23625-24217(-) / protein_length=135 / sequence_SO=supercontig / SO=protein_coding / is_pseudo=false
MEQHQIGIGAQRQNVTERAKETEEQFSHFYGLIEKEKMTKDRPDGFSKIPCIGSYDEDTVKEGLFEFAQGVNQQDFRGSMIIPIPDSTITLPLEDANFSTTGAEIAHDLSYLLTKIDQFIDENKSEESKISRHH